MLYSFTTYQVAIILDHLEEYIVMQWREPDHPAPDSFMKGIIDQTSIDCLLSEITDLWGAMTNSGSIAQDVIASMSEENVTKLFTHVLLAFQKAK